MKKIILSAILIFLSLQIFAQEIPAAKQPFTSADLFKKSKNQKTAAWICLGGGLGLGATGLIITIANGTSDVVSLLVLQPKVHDYRAASALMLIGAAGIVGSIPLFIASSKNNQKARLMLKQEKVSFILPGQSGSRITGLTLSIPLGK